MENTGRQLTDEAQDALTRLVTSVSDYRYAPEGTTIEEHELATSVGLIAGEANLKNHPDRDGAQSALRLGS